MSTQKKDALYYDMEFVAEDQPCMSDDNATVTAWNSATNVSHKRELFHLGLLELNSKTCQSPLYSRHTLKSGVLAQVSRSSDSFKHVYSA